MGQITSALHKTAWGQTLALNHMRAAAGGLVFTLAMQVAHLAGSDGRPWDATTLILPLAFPLMYLVFFLPLGLLAAGVGRLDLGDSVFGVVVVAVGALAGVLSLMIAVGDPVLWTLNKLLPRGLPIVRSTIGFRFINFGLLMPVLKAAEAGLCRSCGGEVSTAAAKCPRCGEPDPRAQVAAADDLSKAGALT